MTKTIAPLQSATSARLTAPYAFYEKDGAARTWFAGQLVDDPMQVSILVERGAPIVDGSIETDGKPLGPVLAEQQVVDKHIVTRNVHLHDPAVTAYLDKEMARLRQTLGNARRIVDDTYAARYEREQARLAALRALQEADRFFDKWRALATDQAHRNLTSAGVINW